MDNLPASEVSIKPLQNTFLIDLEGHSVNSAGNYELVGFRVVVSTRYRASKSKDDKKRKDGERSFGVYTHLEVAFTNL